MHRFVFICCSLILFCSPPLLAKSEDEIVDEKQYIASMANPNDMVITTTPAVDGFRIKE